jgi:hypothetical protein
MIILIFQTCPILESSSIQELDQSIKKYLFVPFPLTKATAEAALGAFASETSEFKVARARSEEAHTKRCNILLPFEKYFTQIPA